MAAVPELPLGFADWVDSLQSDPTFSTSHFDSFVKESAKQHKQSGAKAKISISRPSFAPPRQEPEGLTPSAPAENDSASTIDELSCPTCYVPNVDLSPDEHGSNVNIFASYGSLPVVSSSLTARPPSALSVPVPVAAPAPPSVSFPLAVAAQVPVDDSDSDDDAMLESCFTNFGSAGVPSLPPFVTEDVGTSSAAAAVAEAVGAAGSAGVVATAPDTEALDAAFLRDLDAVCRGLVDPAASVPGTSGGYTASSATADLPPTPQLRPLNSAVCAVMPAISGPRPSCARTAIPAPSACGPTSAPNPPAEPAPSPSNRSRRRTQQPQTFQEPDATVAPSANSRKAASAKDSNKDSHKNRNKNKNKNKDADKDADADKDDAYRNLSAHALQTLKSWMMSAEHFDHPYPDDREKVELAALAGITIKQLTIWFTNARKRLWVPLRKKKGLPIIGYTEYRAMRKQKLVDECAQRTNELKKRQRLAENGEFSTPATHPIVDGDAGVADESDNIPIPESTPEILMSLGISPAAPAPLATAQLNQVLRNSRSEIAGLTARLRALKAQEKAAKVALTSYGQPVDGVPVGPGTMPRPAPLSRPGPSPSMQQESRMMPRGHMTHGYPVASSVPHGWASGADFRDDYFGMPQMFYSGGAPY